MTKFMAYVLQADADYEQGKRDEPLILEQRGTLLVDPVTGTSFPIQSAQPLFIRAGDDMGGGIVVFFGEPNIRIRFAEGGNA